MCSSPLCCIFKAMKTLLYYNLLTEQGGVCMPAMSHFSPRTVWVQRWNRVKMLDTHWILLLAAVDCIYWCLLPHFHSFLLNITLNVFCTGVMMQVAVLVLREWHLHVSLCWSVTLISRSLINSAALITVTSWWAQDYRLWAHSWVRKPRFSHCRSQNKGQRRP